MIERRRFLQVAGIGVLVPTAELLVGCPTLTSIEQEIGKWVPLGITVVDDILSFIPVTAPFVPIISLVKAGFADLSAAVASYNSAPSANKQTFVGKIETALSAITKNFDSLLSQILPTAATNDEKLITQLAQLFLETITGYLAQLGTSTATATATAAMARLSRTSRKTVVPVHRNPEQFKKAWNALAVPTHPALELR